VNISDMLYVLRINRTVLRRH